MRVHMKIRCFNCSKSWAVYDRDDWKSANARTCPYCGESIDSATWDRQVLPAFAQFGDANRELEKDSTGYHAPLFKVNFSSTI